MGVRTVKLSWTVVELDSESHSWTFCEGLNNLKSSKLEGDSVSSTE